LVVWSNNFYKGFFIFSVMTSRKEGYRRRLEPCEIKYVRSAFPKKTSFPYEWVAGELGISEDKAYEMIGGKREISQDTASELYRILKPNAENGELKFLKRLKKTRPRDPSPEELPRDPPKSLLEESVSDGRFYVTFSDMYSDHSSWRNKKDKTS
jgi:hypothetical protein